MNLMIVGILIVVAAIWLFLPRKSKKERAEKARQRKETRSAAVAAKLDHPYQAVSLLSLGGGCPAVESIGQRRFLVGEFPQLPLEECNSKHCSCKYVRHSDRRYDGLGRRLHMGVEADLEEAADLHERRGQVMRGRRKTDIAA